MKLILALLLALPLAANAEVSSAQIELVQQSVACSYVSSEIKDPKGRYFVDLRNDEIIASVYATGLYRSELRIIADTLIFAVVERLKREKPEDLFKQQRALCFRDK